jgi:hypothetical protein
VADYAVPAENITGWKTVDYSLQVSRTGSEITVTGTLGASFPDPVRPVSRSHSLEAGNQGLLPDLKRCRGGGG